MSQRPSMATKDATLFAATKPTYKARAGSSARATDYAQESANSRTPSANPSAKMNTARGAPLKTRYNAQEQFVPKRVLRKKQKSKEHQSKNYSNPYIGPGMPVSVARSASANCRVPTLDKGVQVGTPTYPRPSEGKTPDPRDLSNQETPIFSQTPKEFQESAEEKPRKDTLEEPSRADSQGAHKDSKKYLSVTDVPEEEMGHQEDTPSQDGSQAHDSQQVDDSQNDVPRSQRPTNDPNAKPHQEESDAYHEDEDQPKLQTVATFREGGMFKDQYLEAADEYGGTDADAQDQYADDGNMSEPDYADQEKQREDLSNKDQVLNMQEMNKVPPARRQSCKDDQRSADSRREEPSQERPQPADQEKEDGAQGIFSQSPEQEPRVRTKVVETYNPPPEAEADEELEKAQSEQKKPSKTESRRSSVAPEQVRKAKKAKKSKKPKKKAGDKKKYLTQNAKSASDKKQPAEEPKKSRSIEKLEKKLETLSRQNSNLEDTLLSEKKMNSKIATPASERLATTSFDPDRALKSVMVMPPESEAGQDNTQEPDFVNGSIKESEQIQDLGEDEEPIRDNVQQASQDSVPTDKVERARRESVPADNQKQSQKPVTRVEEKREPPVFEEQRQAPVQEAKRGPPVYEEKIVLTQQEGGVKNVSPRSSEIEVRNEAPLPEPSESPKNEECDVRIEVLTEDPLDYDSQLEEFKKAERELQNDPEFQDEQQQQEKQEPEKPESEKLESEKPVQEKPKKKRKKPAALVEAGKEMKAKKQTKNEKKQSQEVKPAKAARPSSPKQQVKSSRTPQKARAEPKAKKVEKKKQSRNSAMDPKPSKKASKSTNKRNSNDTQNQESVQDQQSVVSGVQDNSLVSIHVDNQKADAEPEELEDKQQAPLANTCDQDTMETVDARDEAPSRHTTIQDSNSFDDLKKGNGPKLTHTVEEASQQVYQEHSPVLTERVTNQSSGAYPATAQECPQTTEQDTNDDKAHHRRSPEIDDSQPRFGTRPDSSVETLREETGVEAYYPVSTHSREHYSQNSFQGYFKPVTDEKVPVQECMEAIDQNRQFCRSILVDVNNARLNPSQFIVSLDKLKKQNDEDPELEELCQEASTFMKEFEEKLQTLQWSPELERSAIDHYLDMVNTGSTQHIGSDGSTCKDRIERYANWGGYIYETIQLRKSETLEDHARNVVLEWVVDSFPGRNNRKNVMLKDHRHFAVVAGPHPSGCYSYIALFASKLRSKNLDLQNFEELETQEKQNAECSDEEKEGLESQKEFDRDIFELQNEVRQDPRSFIPYLEEVSKRYIGNMFFSEDRSTYHETQEGDAAVFEAIEFLKQQNPLPPLDFSSQLQQAAQYLVDDIAPKGIISLHCTNGMKPKHRIENFIRLDNIWGETQVSGVSKAKDVLLVLLVNDGNPDRQFRNTMFSEQHNLCGVASGKHKTHDNMVQIGYGSVNREPQILSSHPTPHFNNQQEQENAHQDGGAYQETFGEGNHNDPRLDQSDMKQTLGQGADNNGIASKSYPQGYDLDGVEDGMETERSRAVNAHESVAKHQGKGKKVIKGKGKKKAAKKKATTQPGRGRQMKRNTTTSGAYLDGRAGQPCSNSVEAEPGHGETLNPESDDQGTNRGFHSANRSVPKGKGSQNKGGKADEIPGYAGSNESFYNYYTANISQLRPQGNSQSKRASSNRK